MAQRLLNEFVLRESIGVGTVGAIHRAEDSARGHDVALKILLKTVCEDELIKARFEREMLILEKLSHPHIVAYYGGGQEGEQFFYAMELVTGGSLKDLLAEYPRLPYLEVATIGVQVCSALQHAHNHGIIHRDLKPSNLLFTKPGAVKLTDFGIALDANAASITATGLTVGSYAYMSPEQITAETAVTGKADLYALGCVLFEMLCGRPPFTGTNFAQLFDQHLKSSPPGPRSLAADCPDELDAVVRQLLAKSPEERPFNARFVQGALLRLLDKEGHNQHDVEGDTLDEENDIPAADAVSLGREALSRRLTSLTSSHRDISAARIVAVFLIAALLVAAGWLARGLF